MLLLQLFSIFVLGLIGGAVPGPILTSLFADVLRKGFLKTLIVILKAAAVESSMAFLVITVFSAIKIPEIVFYVLSFIGAFVLISLAKEIWQIKLLDAKGDILTFKKFIALVFFSGPFWIFWTTICVPQAFLLSQKITGGQFIFWIIFEIGWLLSTLLLVFVFSRFRTFLIQGDLTNKVFKTLALFLIFLALKMTYDSIAYLMSLW
jgi:threonine/homoserine/homoserine lactone efflux protein